MSKFSLENYPHRAYIKWAYRNWYDKDTAINNDNIPKIVDWLCDEVGSTYLKSGFFRDKVTNTRNSFLTSDDDKSTWTARWPGSKSKKLIFYFKNEEDLLKFILTWT